MSAAIIYILFAISTGSMPPDLTALAEFETRETCDAAAGQISQALSKSDDPKVMLCVASDSLQEMARKNATPGN